VDEEAVNDSTGWHQEGHTEIFAPRIKVASG